ncbi:hypothetical protein WR25_08760 [Diploscapter pachys]|uniref:Uncharacterized protein n=1 Tax=Diploscapter pachys TaxID=2018661 RepID=A0A2A2KK04_9BILA|nr:hypothetical protein WR25_08760 [Diploscapter pachys]
MDEYYSLYKKALGKTRGKKRLWYLENGYNSEAEKSAEEEGDEEGSEAVSGEEEETTIPEKNLKKVSPVIKPAEKLHSWEDEEKWESKFVMGTGKKGGVDSLVDNHGSGVTSDGTEELPEINSEEIEKSRVIEAPKKPFDDTDEELPEISSAELEGSKVPAIEAPPQPASASAAVPSRLASPKKKKKPIDDDLGDEDDLEEITSAEIEHEKARLTNNNRLTGANARVPEEDKSAASPVVSAKSLPSKSSLEQIEDDAFPDISSAELEKKFNPPTMNSKTAVGTVESSQVAVTTTPSPKASIENIDDDELPELSSAELEGSSSSSSSTSAPTTTVMSETTTDMISSAMQSKSVDEELFEFNFKEIETSSNEISTTTTIQPITSETAELPKKLVTDIEEELTEISSKEFETTAASVTPTTTTLLTLPATAAPAPRPQLPNLGGVNVGSNVGVGPVGVSSGLGISAPGIGGGGGAGLFGIGSGVGVSAPFVGPIGVSSGLGIGEIEKLRQEAKQEIGVTNLRGKGVRSGTGLAISAHQICRFE